MIFSHLPAQRKVRCCGAEKKDMDVVFHGIENQDGTVQIFENSGKVGVEIRANSSAKPRFPVLGRENEVNQIVGERLWRRLGRPFRAWGSWVRQPRALPWAVLGRPFGAWE